MFEYLVRGNVVGEPERTITVLADTAAGAIYIAKSEFDFVTWVERK